MRFWASLSRLPVSASRRPGVVDETSLLSSLRHLGIKALSSGPTVPQKPTVSPQPGTVTPYSHHVLLRLAPPAGQPIGTREIWWPSILEKHPALVQAFTAVAEVKQSIDGIVKVSAYEELDSQPRSGRGSGARVDMMIFPAGIEYNGLPLTRIKEAVKHHISEPLSGDDEISSPLHFPKAPQSQVNGLLLFVCTHMSRDCRCGVLGREAAEKLQALAVEEGFDLVKVYQISHIGGHKYAGNVLVYGGISPCDGDWFGGITAANASEFLRALVNAEVGQDGGVESPALRKWWRGRIGLSREEQIAAFREGSGIPAAVTLGAIEVGNSPSAESERPAANGTGTASMRAQNTSGSDESSSDSSSSDSSSSDSSGEGDPLQ